MLQIKYKEAHVREKGHMLGTPVTPEMALSKDLKNVVSKKGYAEKSKQDQAKIHLNVGKYKSLDVFISSKSFYKYIF